jgi:hypothetical protein
MRCFKKNNSTAWSDFFMPPAPCKAYESQPETQKFLMQFSLKSKMRVSNYE